MGATTSSRKTTPSTIATTGMRYVVVDMRGAPTRPASVAESALATPVPTTPRNTTAKTAPVLNPGATNPAAANGASNTPETRSAHRMTAGPPYFCWSGTMMFEFMACLLYTSDAADDLLCVDLGG